MVNENDVSSTWKRIVDENQYDYLKEKLWKFLEKEDFTDTLIVTDKDEKYVKKVHLLILDCFCKKATLFMISKNGCDSEKTLSLHHEVDTIDYVINLLYLGKCVVPITMLSEFMDLANHLSISEIFVYDERGCYYFIYLMKHKSKFLNYLYFIKKNNIHCDINVISRDFKCIPVHISILAAYSNKFFHYIKNRITIKNPVSALLPVNAEELEKILMFCYFGQIVFTRSELNLLSVVYIVGVDRILEKCKLTRKHNNLYDENSFEVFKPPAKSKPEILEKVRNNLHHYVYLWIENRCVLVPVACFHVLNFQNDCNAIKDNFGNDIVVFLKKAHHPIIRKFLYCLYTWEYSEDIEPFIDMFGLEWPTIFEPETKKVCNDVCSTLYANNLEDLRNICEKVFEEECREGEMMIQLFTCQDCDEQLLSKRALHIHYQTRHETGYLCDKCGKIFCRQYFFLHRRRHDSTKKNQCDRCFKEFPSAYGLKRHLVNFSCCLEKCTECGKTVRQDRINQHISKNHRVLHCSFCTKKFKSQQYLQRHVIQNQLGKEVKCLHCRETFTTKCHIKFHVFKCHETTFKCSLCGLKLNSERQLSKHINTSHIDQQITCTICGKIYTRFASLRIHLRSHTGEKPYRCHVCYTTFARPDTMYYHIRQVHGERRYVCPICHKRYSSRSYFLEHGWIAHQTFIEPEVNLVEKLLNDQEDLANLNPDTLYKQVANSAPGLVEVPNGSISQENVSFCCPICSISYKNFSELISHLDIHV